MNQDQDPPRAGRKVNFKLRTLTIQLFIASIHFYFFHLCLQVRFQPKPPPPKKKSKPPASGSEDAEEEQQNTEVDRSLLRQWNERVARSTPKVETQSSHQVAFGPGDSSSPMLRTYGKSSGGSSSEAFSNDLNALKLSSTAEDDKSVTFMSDGEDMYDGEDTTKASETKNKMYKEPWDYQHSYYPTTLPLRKPYSGDPEILDEEEFGEAAANVEYDENKINSAAELGLKEKSEQQKMILFKFPLTLPLEEQTRKGKEKVGTSTASKEPGKKEGPFEGLQKGKMGKMLVYKSGAVKLKIGEILFDVTPGSNSDEAAQYATAMNAVKKQCCTLGQLGKNAVVIPDLDSVDLQGDKRQT
ncbi:hypothetical protein PIB30_001192 [Stylosanthes scabra]|uniref:RNA polymerase III RPC4 n=1 Tax=Stylosanthes scabra TaxID=79078 RepID=A0ABU6V5U3_9FABA|nr:hypothetical protein [Stylosanthes scabra]